MSASWMCSATQMRPVLTQLAVTCVLAVMGIKGMGSLIVQVSFCECATGLSVPLSALAMRSLYNSTVTLIAH